MKSLKMVGVALVAVVMMGLAGCASMTQEDMNALAQTAGVAAVTAYNMDAEKLTPQQKQAAQIAVSVMGVIAQTVNTGNIGDIQSMINQYIRDHIKDPQQAVQAQAVVTLFLSAVNPTIKNQIAKHQSDAAVQIFIAFCQGVNSTPLAKSVVPNK